MCAADIVLILVALAFAWEYGRARYRGLHGDALYNPEHRTCRRVHRYQDRVGIRAAV